MCLGVYFYGCPYLIYIYMLIYWSVTSQPRPRVLKNKPSKEIIIADDDDVWVWYTIYAFCINIELNFYLCIKCWNIKWWWRQKCCQHEKYQKVNYILLLNVWFIEVFFSAMSIDNEEWELTPRRGYIFSCF